MRIASIDLGTNTALLLIADVMPDGTLTPILEEQRMPRIGRDVDEKQQIQQSAFERARLVFLEYKEIISANKVDKIIACATSAVRDAANKTAFLDYLAGETGITVEVISGENEAQLTYAGAVSGLPATAKAYAPPYLVLDIGGGSTELSYYDPTNNFKQHSLQLGSVRVTERFFKHDPPIVLEIIKARKFINDTFRDEIPFDADTLPFNSLTLVGVAGTATTLACLEQGLKKFEVKKVAGYRMKKEQVQEWFKKLSVLPTEEILTLSETTEGRADILTAGALILFEFMNHFGFNELIVSERGLRYGMAMKGI